MTRVKKVPTEGAVLRWLEEKNTSSLIGRGFDARQDANEFAEWFVNIYEQVMAHEHARALQLSADVPTGSSDDEVYVPIEKGCFE